MTTQNGNKKDSQRRIIVATVLSFLFFIAYDYLYMQPQQQAAQAQKAAQAQQQANQAPQVQTTATPSVVTNVATTNSPSVPKVNSNNHGIITTVTTNNSIIQIDTLGRIAQATLTQEQYKTDDGERIKLFSDIQLRPLEIRFADRGVNAEAFKTPVTASSATVNAKNGAQKLVLTQKLTSTIVTKTLTFYPDGHYDLDVDVSNGFEYFITPGFRPDVIADMYADHGALLKMNDDSLTIVEDEDLEHTNTFTGIKIASAFDRYYATVFYNFGTSMQVSLMPSNDDSPEIFVHGKDKLSVKGYMGPKDYVTLESLHPELIDVIEYGWFTFIAKPMFSMLLFIYNIIGNWGWTIVATTIIIKLILFPLAHKGMVSMNKLKELSPKIKSIQEKYDDKQKQSAAMMELYKKEGANPMGGCLPILLQIPVFFAIYRVLTNAIELKGAEWFLWFDDMTHEIVFPNLLDPYIVLPLLMGLTMYLQQKITPNTIQDELQKKMFQFLPVVFTIFFIFFPAGLVLYWTVNNIFTVTHQYYLNRMFENARVQRHEDHLQSKKKNKKDK